MGLFLPMVGYVAARNHNDDKEKKAWNRKRIAAVDMFVGAMRIAYLEGWGGALSPLMERESSTKESFSIHEKSFEHRIFFERDLINRPKMKEMMDFIMSEPRGGTICVLDKVDLFNNQTDKYTITQCKIVQLMLNSPVLECGFTNNRGSLNGKLARGYRNSQVIYDIVVSALSLREGHTRRLGAVDFKKRLCDMRDADPSGRAMSEAYDTGALCPDCMGKVTAYRNARNPPLEHPPATRDRGIG